MKKKLLKRLTTVVVVTAMVATMVIALTTDVKADAPDVDLWPTSSIDHMNGNCNHKNEEHFYIAGTYEKNGTTYIMGRRYDSDGSIGTNMQGDIVNYFDPDEGGYPAYLSWFPDSHEVGWYYDTGDFKYACPSEEQDPAPTPDKPVNKTEKKKSESKYIAPKEENPAFTHPDREKLKSILPQKTVIALEGNLYDDLKVFNADEKTKVNQALLVNNFAQTAGKKARIILTDTLHTNRMLGADNGRAKTLIWANLEKGPQAVYALCYNQNEKAYFISGILDKDGTATFNDFILRDMTNITIFVLE